MKKKILVGLISILALPAFASQESVSCYASFTKAMLPMMLETDGVSNYQITEDDVAVYTQKLFGSVVNKATMTSDDQTTEVVSYSYPDQVDFNTTSLSSKLAFVWGDDVGNLIFLKMRAALNKDGLPKECTNIIHINLGATLTIGFAKQ